MRFSATILIGGFGLLMSLAAVISAHGGTMKPLSEEEARIIIHKGTEAPFSGTLLHNTAQGTYVCRQCGAPLYASDAKFDSGCGWPSFDATLPHAVKRQPDADGRRVEIVCAQCGGHLGHVFEGEGFTPKNTRHCVNSVSLQFTPQGAQNIAAGPEDAPATTAPTAAAREDAYFAGGCFWGVEDAFSKVPGVLDVVSGYMGGTTENPTYAQVCTGTTGHAETVRVTFDPHSVDYATLARLFFEIHDPTTKNRQGPDVGTQYRSAIFVTSPAQEATVRDLLAQLKSNGWNAVTEVSPAKKFFPAEEYHQNYTARTGRGGCHAKVPRFTVRGSKD